MSIWFVPPDIEHLNRIHAATAVSALGITITAVGEDSLSGTMPVDQRTLQPYGLLHGGASVLLAETLGTAASICCVDPKQAYCVGLEINANHLRAVKDGVVTGTGLPIHVGRSTQVWEVRIVDEQSRPVCVSRCTLAVVPNKASREA